MQINLNAEFDKLIEKCNIEYCQTRYSLETQINEIFHEIDDDLIFAIRGGGEHTEKLLEILDEENKNKIDYIIDKQVKQEFLFGIKVIALEEMHNMDIDVVMVSSYAYRKEMVRELFSLFKEVTVLELYDSLEKRGIKCNNAFYIIPGYLDVYCVEQYYKQAKIEGDKQYYLKKMIGYYLVLCDFINAEVSIKEYIEKDYEDASKYLEFWKECQKLFKKVKKALEERKEKDIVINWVDALRYKELPEMKYLSQMSQKSIYFENAYTTMPWTTMTFCMIMTNQLVIDDKVYKIRLLDESNSVILQYLKEKGYSFKYIGSSKSIRKRIRRENVPCGIIKENEGINVSCNQWNAINEILLSEKPICLLIHSLAETHPHFWSCGMDTLLYKNEGEKNESKYLEQLTRSRTYLDEQLEWYQRLYGNSIVNIVMSDHGKNPVETMWLGNKSDEMIHICMMIYGDSISHQKVSKLFQLNDMVKVLRYIIEPERYNLDSVCRKVICIQALDTYDAHLVSGLLESENENLYNWIQYRGLRTENELYIRDVSGREIYIRYPDEEKNLIDSPEYQERIEELRNMDKGKFINVFKDDYFKESLRVYERLGLTEEDIIRANEQQ